MNLKKAKRLRRFCRDQGADPKVRELGIVKIHEKIYPPLNIKVQVGTIVNNPELGRGVYRALKRATKKGSVNYV